MAKKPNKLSSDDFPGLHADHRKRLRGRILRSGASCLEPHELLEVLLFLPIARRDTNHLAHMLVERFGSVELALRRPAEDLMQIPGIGEQSARFLHDIGRVIEAYARSKRRGRAVLSDSAEAKQLALEFFAENPDAGCVMFSLDDAMRLLAMSALPHDPSTQELIRTAVQFRTTCAVMALRDDSVPGKPKHREAAVFRALQNVFSLLDVVFVDYLIVGGNGVRSYLERRKKVDCAAYSEDSTLHEISLHFAGGREAMRFADVVSGGAAVEDGDELRDESFDADAVAAFAGGEDAADAFSGAAIDPEEIFETVVEPLGTVAQISGTETASAGATPFSDLLTDSEADEVPF